MPNVRLPVLLLLALAASPLTAQAPGASPATDMLEGVLPGVLTVAVESADLPLAYGFSEQTVARTAYRRSLDLGGYAGSGSGFVLIRDGVPYLITNAHVVEGSDQGALHAYSVDRSRYVVEIVGADSYRDVAVLRFRDQPGREVGALEIRRGDLRIAEPVFAIGNPLGQLPYSVSAGIVSGLNRTLTGLTGREGYVQTDAVVAGGNSGGPLVGMDGRVVGLVTQGLTEAPINFALEAEHLLRFVDDIIRHGRVQRAHLGVLVQEREVPGGAEVFIASTLEGGPADGPLDPFVGWNIVSIGGHEVGSLSDALPVVETLRPGQNVEVVVARSDGTRQTATVPTTSLSESRSAGFAREALRQFVEIQVDDADAGIRVASAPPAEAESRMNVHNINSSFRSPMRPGEKIVAAGYYNGNGSTFWGTPGLHELGVALRLVMRTGWIALVVEDAKGGVRVIDTAIPATSML